LNNKDCQQLEKDFHKVILKNQQTACISEELLSILGSRYHRRCIRVLHLPSVIAGTGSTVAAHSTTINSSGGPIVPVVHGVLPIPKLDSLTGEMRNLGGRKSHQKIHQPQVSCSQSQTMGVQLCLMAVYGLEREVVRQGRHLIITANQLPASP
jgi:hypothetical protein